MAQITIHENTVGTIYTASDNSKELQVKGTAFVFLAKNMVLTVKHNLPKDVKKIFYRPFGTNQNIPMKIVYESIKKDLALLESESKIAESYYSNGDFTKFEPGANIVFLGLNVSENKYEMHKAFVHLKGKYVDGIENVEVIEFIDENIKSGFSGGPIFDENGLIIAIIDSSVIHNHPYKKENPPQQFCKGYSIQDAVDFFNSNYNVSKE